MHVVHILCMSDNWEDWPPPQTTSYLLKFALTFSRFLKGAFLSNTFKLESCCSSPLFLPPALLLVWASQASSGSKQGEYCLTHH